MHSVHFKVLSYANDFDYRHYSSGHFAGTALHPLASALEAFHQSPGLRESNKQLLINGFDALLAIQQQLHYLRRWTRFWLKRHNGKWPTPEGDRVASVGTFSI